MTQTVVTAFPDRRTGFARLRQLTQRPSNTIMFNRLDRFSVRWLIALYEQKVAAQGCLWGIDSFDQWGVELGKQLASGILPDLTPKAERGRHDSSTSALSERFLTLHGDT